MRDYKRNLRVGISKEKACKMAARLGFWQSEYSWAYFNDVLKIIVKIKQNRLYTC